MANLYDTDYFSNWNNQNTNNQNNAGLFDYRNALGDNWALPYAPQDINTPLRDNIPFKPNQGNIPYTPQEKKGFSFNPFNWGIMGIAKKMIEPNTPEENFGRRYFNMDSAGRTYGNQAHDVFAGKNVASAFGKGMGAAAQKRIDTIENTLRTKYNLGDEEIEDVYAGTYTGPIKSQLIQRLRNFSTDLSGYQKDLAAGTGGQDTTGGAVTTGNVVTNVTNPNVGGNGASRDQGGGYSTRGGFTGTRGQEPGTRGGATSGSGRGHHSWRAKGGRVGLRLGGDPEEPAENIFEFMQDQGINYNQMAEGVEQKFLSDELGAIDVTDEEIAMITDLLGRKTDISTISTLTGKDEGTIERVIRVLTTQSQAQGGSVGYFDGGIASLV